MIAPLLAAAFLSIASAKGAIYGVERDSYQPASHARVWVDSCHRHAPDVVVCIAHMTVTDYSEGGEVETLTRYEVRDTASATARGVRVWQDEAVLVRVSAGD